MTEALCTEQVSVQRVIIRSCSMTEALCIEQIRVQRVITRSCSMTEALCIDNLKDCGFTLKDCAIPLRLRRLNGTLHGDTVKVLQLNNEGR